MVEVHQTLHDEWLEQLERHLLGQTALVQLQLWTDDDNRTTGVVDSLAEQVLAEATLLALEHVGQRLQRTVARASDWTTAAAVVEQCVNSFLKHALLVVDDDLRSAQIEQTLQAVVAVDHSTVEIIEIGGRETSTIELHHRAQIRRDHRNTVQNHAHGRVRGLHERGDNLESLQGAGLLLTLTRLHDLTKELGLGLQIKGLQALLDCGCTHTTVEVAAIAVTHLTVEELITLEVLHLQGAEPVEDSIQTLDLGIGATTHLSHLALG